MSDPRRDDQGFTLIELIIYMMLLILVVGIASGMLISVLRNSKTVRTVAEATTAGQLVADSIEAGIRNSSDFQLSNPSGNDQLLIARTASSGDALNWSCFAWYYSAEGDGSIRTHRSSTAILPPTASELGSWTLLDTGIKPTTGTGVFSATGKQLIVDFEGTVAGHPPIDIRSGAMSRAGASGDLSCY